MPLNVNSSRALRSPKELTDLIQAVLAASANDEASWIEWKSGLPLGDKETRVHLARHILGMANRPVDEASRHAEGCGYIVIGAEPGHCDGVTEIDPADLDAGLRPYVGSDGPRWSAQYLKWQGNSVLVITVDPPRRGDRAFTLQKTYGNYYAGQIFIRRPGRTIPAEPGDIRTLEDRFAATGNPVTLHVRPSKAGGALSIPLDASHTQLFEAWEVKTRAELLPSNSPLTLVGRSINEYQAEVDQYLEKCRPYYLKAVAALIAQSGDNLMRLSLVNTSDRNYVDIRIEIRIEALTYASDPEKLARLPQPPKRPGVQGVRQMPSFPYDFASLAPAKVVMPSIPKFTIDYTGNSTVVTYDITRIRPEQQILLDPVFILAIDQPIGEVKVIWRVSAGNVDGVVDGDFSAITAPPAGIENLTPEFIFRQPKDTHGFRAL